MGRGSKRTGESSATSAARFFAARPTKRPRNFPTSLYSPCSLCAYGRGKIARDTAFVVTLDNGHEAPVCPFHAHKLAPRVVSMRAV